MLKKQILNYSDKEIDAQILSIVAKLYAPRRFWAVVVPNAL